MELKKRTHPARRSNSLVWPSLLRSHLCARVDLPPQVYTKSPRPNLDRPNVCLCSCFTVKNCRTIAVVTWKKPGNKLEVTSRYHILTPFTTPSNHTIFFKNVHQHTPADLVKQRVTRPVCWHNLIEECRLGGLRSFRPVMTPEILLNTFSGNGLIRCPELRPSSACRRGSCASKLESSVPPCHANQVSLVHVSPTNNGLARYPHRKNSSVSPGHTCSAPWRDTPFKLHRS